jgi:polysaccharide export outer membrane protein
MARTRVPFPRRIALGCVLALLVPFGAHAQMIGGGVSNMQAVQAAANPSTVVGTQPNSAYSNPYSNNGVARPTINGQRDPYANYAYRTGAPPGMYASPLGTTGSYLPASGVHTTAPSAAQAYAGAPGAYGGADEPAAAPTYSIQAAPVGGPYALAPQPYPRQGYAQPAYAQPASAQPRPQYYPPPQYAPAPRYAPAPQTAQAAGNGMTPVAMTPGNNLIPSPYAAMRAASAPVGAPAEGGYTLGPGDKIRLTVFGETDLSGEYQLDGNGNIRLPLAGVVHAGGNTAQGLEALIVGALVPNYLRNPRINVEITSYRPVYVVGQVQKPGQYAYVNDMTLLNAIGLAGGFTPQAKESTVYVRHAGEAAEERAATAQPLLIRPGDTIRVTSTLFWDAMNMFAPLSGPAYLASAVVQ